MKDGIIGHSKITSNKHISLPKNVQKALGGVEEGQYILFYVENGKIWIKKGELKPIE